MKFFIRKRSIGEDFNVFHSLDEYCREYVVRYGDFILTGYVDCPQTLQSGLVRISINAGLGLDDFISIYNNLNDTQIHMLKEALPNFMGWLINTKYDKDFDYVHFCRTDSNRSGGIIWLICNIVELESEKSIIEGILDLSYMAAMTIKEIQDSNISFANSEHLLSPETRNRMDVVEGFIDYCQR